MSKYRNSVWHVTSKEQGRHILDVLYAEGYKDIDAEFYLRDYPEGMTLYVLDKEVWGVDGTPHYGGSINRTNDPEFLVVAPKKYRLKTKEELIAEGIFDHTASRTHAYYSSERGNKNCITESMLEELADGFDSDRGEEKGWTILPWMCTPLKPLFLEETEDHSHEERRESREGYSGCIVYPKSNEEKKIIARILAERGMEVSALFDEHLPLYSHEGKTWFNCGEKDYEKGGSREFRDVTSDFLPESEEAGVSVVAVTDWVTTFRDTKCATTEEETPSILNEKRRYANLI